MPNNLHIIPAVHHLCNEISGAADDLLSFSLDNNGWSNSDGTRQKHQWNTQMYQWFSDDCEWLQGLDEWDRNGQMEGESIQTAELLQGCLGDSRIGKWIFRYRF